MLKRIVYRLLRHRHFWRDASFDELSELYINMIFRSIALSLIGIFIPVFLLKNGYEIHQILRFFVTFFSVRILMDVLGAYLIAFAGPKHTMLVSYACQILASLVFLTLPTHHWPLILPAFLYATANSLFFIAFHVDFSKVKHSQHGGKELGFISVIDRIGGALGPVVGGFIAYAFGAEYIFMVATVLLCFGLVPLFRTAEPVKLRQHLKFRDLPYARIRRDLFSFAAINVENNLCITLWPLFLAAFVFTTNVYLKLGTLTSIGVMSSIVAAYGIGKLIDQKRGGQLLRFGATANALLHLARPFVTTLPFALVVSVINEIVTVSYRLPFHKGMYDAADQLPGYRIAYLTVMELTGSVTKLFVWISLYSLSLVAADKMVITTGFFVAAAASLLIMTQRFKALEYSK